MWLPLPSSPLVIFLLPNFVISLDQLHLGEKYSVPLVISFYKYSSKGEPTVITILPFFPPFLFHCSSSSRISLLQVKHQSRILGGRREIIHQWNGESSEKEWRQRNKEEGRTTLCQRRIKTVSERKWVGGIRDKGITRTRPHTKRREGKGRERR